MRVTNTTIPNFIAGDMSGNLTSPGMQVNQVFGWSASFVFTGAPVGVLKVQVSNDPLINSDATPVQPTHWTDLVNSATAISAAGDITFNVDLAFYNWIRFIYTATSGTGSINGRLNLKGI